MSLLSDSEIEAMRTTAEEALPAVATIEARIEKSDGQGGREETTKPVAENVPCRIDPRRKTGEAEALAGGRPSADSDFLITLPAETIVLPTYILQVNGRTFEVDRARDRDQWELTMRVEASEIDVGGPAGSS